MNEAQRLAYLEAMDIESFYSRQPLPGAAPSRRVRVVRRSETPAETSAGDAVRQLKSHVPAPARAVPPAPAVAAHPSADAAVDELPIFSLAVTVAGGCLWLDHLPPGRNPGQDYARLMEAI